jgi:hypothetical protein
MDKIESGDADTNDKSPSTQTSKRSRSQPRYQTSTDLAINTLDALAEISPYITLPAKGSNA